ncbi:MAG: ligase-associated DNA damage response endonuclease PdeM [Planctomycetota bacterium]
MPLQLGETVVELLAQRAVWVAHERTLLVADLHWGKSETLRRAGAPIPSGVLAAQFDALDTLVHTHDADRLIVLGDLLHAPVGITDELVERAAAWRRSWGGSFELVEGNHDRRVERVADAMGVTLLGAAAALGEGPAGLDLVHDPAHASPGRPTLAGHIHPAVTLRGGGDRVKLPCFWLSTQTLVLPAFTPFAAGAPIRPAPGDRVVACAQDRLVEAPVVRSRAQRSKPRSPAR